MKLSAHWGSHLPVLIALLPRTAGPVLELGTGLYSTPFLHWSCHPVRRLVSYESDTGYLRVASRYIDPRFHDVRLAEDWDAVDLAEHRWAVAFVDHHPDARRGHDAARLAALADYVVLHDTTPRDAAAFGYDEAFAAFRYRLDYTGARPHTSVLSNVHDLEELRACVTCRS